MPDLTRDEVERRLAVINPNALLGALGGHTAERDALLTARNLYAERDEALQKLDEATGFDGIMRQIDTYYPLEVPYFHDSSDPGCVAMRAQRQCLLATERAEKAEAERDQLASEGRVLKEALEHVHARASEWVKLYLYHQALGRLVSISNATTPEKYAAPLIATETARVKRLEAVAEAGEEIETMLDSLMGEEPTDWYSDDPLVAATVRLRIALAAWREGKPDAE